MMGVHLLLVIDWKSVLTQVSCLSFNCIHVCSRYTATMCVPAYQKSRKFDRKIL